MAEIELAMLAGQCLDRRLADRATLEREVAAWQAARNRAGAGQLALHHRGRPHQAQAPLPHNSRLTSTRVVPESEKVGMSQKISRAGVASFLLQAATEDLYSRGGVVITG